MKLASTARMMLVLIGFVAFTSTMARADVLVSSLGLPQGGLGGISNTGVTGFAEAQVFRTNSQLWQLDSIDALVGNLDLSVLSPGVQPNVFAELRLNDSLTNLPVAGNAGVVGTFTFSAIPARPTLAVTTFTPTSTITLSRFTRYWFVLGESSTASDDRYDWVFAATPGPIAGPGTMPALFAETTTSGQDWTTSPGNPYLMQVNATIIGPAAPEPSAFALLVAAGPAVGLIVRRRRSAR
jgi:hypothetical protein